MSVIPFASPLLRVRDLSVVLEDGAEVVGGIGFTIAPGEIVGLVGESGSGKTTIATALLGHTRPGSRIADGAVLVDGVDLLGLPPERLRAARGPTIAHVAQDPAMALNPMHRIGGHLDEVLRIHRPQLDAAARAARIAEVAADVGLPSSEEFLRRFPHQLSGGQQQRVLLALAFILHPRLIVLDEPTTALDVSTQARVLGTVRRLCRDRGIAALYVSHDLAVVRELVDRVIVLYAGRVAETASRTALFDTPTHPYTRGLLDAIPDIAGRRRLRPIAGHAPAPAQRPDGCAFAPRCDRATGICRDLRPIPTPTGDQHLVACHHPDGSPIAIVEPTSPTIEAEAGTILARLSDVSAHYGAKQVLFDVTLTLPTGRCTALVGESGSGKTTLARAIVGLGVSVDGTLDYDGGRVALGDPARPKELRRRIQYIFQNPYRALNPRHSVGEILRAALRHFFAIDAAEANVRAMAALERVALPADILDRRPRDLSGGERQRVAIARALVCEPELLVCDEITSALDVSVQAAILALLARLQADGLTILFVTHDLAVVRAIADRVAVLRGGRIVEEGAVDAVLDRPDHDYTRALLADTPRLRVAEPAFA